MRTLKFIVTDKTLAQDPTCSFNGLFPAPNQKIEAKFSFSKEWENIPKVAAFYSLLNREFEPQVLNEENRCLIPKEALNLPVFRIQILGFDRDRILETTTLNVIQKGGTL